MTLERFDIQGNVLRGYKLGYAGHLFAEIGEAELARAWLAGAVERVTTAEVQAGSELRVACNIGFSAPGLERLDVPPALRAGFSDEFQKGMAGRSDELGDRGPSHPEHWTVDTFRDRSAHLVVSVYAHTPELRKREFDRLRKEFDRHDMKVRHCREVERRKHEHFGFADGLAQPRIDGAGPDERRVRSSSPTVSPLPAGEFLLGYRDLEGIRTAGPPGSLGRNGTYMVYREFRQDVAAFRRFLREQSAAWGLPEELLAAKIVGRWRNGTPLAVSPDDDRLLHGRADPRLNDFGYAEDPDGFRCPLGAHIRRTNPRDSGRLGLGVANRHRMIRRGMPWGPELAEHALSDDGEKRGLAFICFVGSIERQFEFVLRQWCYDGNAFGLGAEGDFLVDTNSREGAMTINGTPPIFLSRPGNRSRGAAPFITTWGGEYFYLPGIAGLRTLARGTTYD
jgi:Dyp-type peroxidase family